MKLIIPAPGYEGQFVSTAGTTKRSKRSKQVTHVVRSGETISTIAEKYQVKQADLMKWNGVKRRTIRTDKVKRACRYQWKSYTVRR